VLLAGALRVTLGARAPKLQRTLEAPEAAGMCSALPGA